MKKILILFLIVVSLSLIVIYSFIKNSVIITEYATVPGTKAAIDSSLHSVQKWKDWWPSPDAIQLSPGDSFYAFNKISYRLKEKFSDGAAVAIQNGDLNITSQIQSVPKNKDTLYIQWTASFPSGLNPVTRVRNYFKGKSLKQDMKKILKAICDYAQLPENIYGFSINRTTFTDTILIAKRFDGVSPATTADIYKNIAQLKEFISRQGAVEKDSPMLNISYSKDSTHYEAMIAICVDRELPSSGGFFLRRMVPMKDRFLACEVKGGPFLIQQAHRAIEKYMFDNSLSAPAIPFEVMLTDRLQERDTSKWITKIFYPSM